MCVQWLDWWAYLQAFAAVCADGRSRRKTSRICDLGADPAFSGGARRAIECGWTCNTKRKKFYFLVPVCPRLFVIFTFF